MSVRQARSDYSDRDRERLSPIRNDVLLNSLESATTTIITKDRVYIPAPRDFEPVFHITADAKEFYVRFDTIP